MKHIVECIIVGYKMYYSFETCSIYTAQNLDVESSKYKYSSK